MRSRRKPEKMEKTINRQRVLLEHLRPSSSSPSRKNESSLSVSCLCLQNLFVSSGKAGDLCFTPFKFFRFFPLFVGVVEFIVDLGRL